MFMIFVLLMVVMVRGLLLMWRRTGNPQSTPPHA